MPRLKNAVKALRQSKKNQTRNTDVKNNLDFLMRKSKRLAETKDAKAAEMTKAVIKALDKASQKGVLKKNTVARRKSRFLKAMKAMVK